ncbi:MAG: hypothetical protein QWI36_04595 [Wolbachia endosymbiont of Tyrophagus putrescentiae]|nr:hypothetical protein [Wolbachia endosymbiont of Tyrophagus putrescentiae]
MHKIKSIVEGHLKFFSDVASGGSYDEITKWVKKNLVECSIERDNINAFFQAEKEFIKGCISISDFDKIEGVVNAVDSIEFRQNNPKKYEQLKDCQRKVLEDTIKETKGGTMLEKLNGLLTSRKEELEALKKSSTSVTSPHIEQHRSSGSSKSQ